MDARLAPEAAYGLPLGSVNIIRNAGGSARDALRSLLLSNHLLGTEEVLIVKHTKCGLLGATNKMGRELLKANLGIKESEELDNMDFLPIEDLEKATKDDVEYYRNHKLRLAKVKVSGWIHDVDTGIIKKIVE
jgi:carbonic anhydrase